ncbi:MAG: LPXTG cell wall anchor domain-containing protein, partial [Pediococcus sp.]|nr:LPXTG cell wall anchor domain-containing protein [Pediococcus sp.]
SAAAAKVAAANAKDVAASVSTKGSKDAVAAVAKENATTLPQTGENNNETVAAVGLVGAVSALFGLGVLNRKRRI